jgi:hypothetical protein
MRALPYYIVAVVLLVLLLCGRADAAASYNVNVAAAAPVNNPWVNTASDVATAEWGGLPCSSSIVSSLDVPTAGAVGPDQGYCLVALNPIWLAGELALIESANVYNRRSGLRDLCHVLVHEFGHLGGLRDGDPASLSGVMTAAVWTLWLPRCTEWINSVAPVPSFVPGRVSTAIRPAKGLRRAVLRPCRTRRCLRRSKVRLARLMEDGRLRSLHASHHRTRR